MIRIALDERDFRYLVSGGVVSRNGVEIILSDIGFGPMSFILNEEWGSAVRRANEEEGGSEA